MTGRRTPILLLVTLLGAPSSAWAEDEKGADDIANLAVRSEPPVRGTRWGSLGVPTSHTGGPMVAAEPQISGDGSFSLDVFAGIGRLSLLEKERTWVTIDVIVDTFKQDVPSSTINIDPEVTYTRPLPALTTQEVTSAGFRLMLGHSPTSSSEWSKRGEAISECLTDIQVTREDTGITDSERAQALDDLTTTDGTACHTSRIDATKSTEKTTIAAWARHFRSRYDGFNAHLGARALYKPGAASPDAGGLAMEFAMQYQTKAVVVNASLAASHLFGASTTTGTLVNEQHALWDVGGRLGFEWQGIGAGPGGKAVALPRVGTYVAVGGNFWENRFATPTMDRQIEGLRMETALYLGGHFTGGFSGTLAVGYARPYGASTDDVGESIFVKIIPSFGGQQLKREDKP